MFNFSIISYLKTQLNDKGNSAQLPQQVVKYCPFQLADGLYACSFSKTALSKIFPQ
jgi:hypothetical protein